MLKTSGGTKSKTQPGEGGVGVGSRRAGRGGSKLGDGSGMDDVEVDGGEVEVGEKGRNLSKSKKTELGFLTSGARKAFTELRQAFIKAPILQHFDPKRHIRVETDASGYATGGVLSQLTSDDLGQWHSVAFFSRKMIPAETRYETHDGKLLAIIEAFKTWKHYLEESQHEMFVLTDHNNLRRFIETKSVSSKQVRWAQEFSCYHFRIDYRQGKANRATDALSRYSQQSAEEEETLHSENVKILHRLQSSLAKVSGLSTSRLSPLHQILICGTTVFPRLNEFWDSLRAELNEEGPY